MATTPLPPPPIGEPADSPLWTDWYNRLATRPLLAISTIGPLSEISANLGTITSGSINGVTSSDPLSSINPNLGAITAGTINGVTSSSPLSAITPDLGEITSGSIRGVNVNAASHTTKGSYITAATLAAATQVLVRNTTDFSSSGGTAIIIDTVNDGDIFTYTGKTSSSLTGCSGLLAHNNGATIIPTGQVVVLDGTTNKLVFYADVGDGTFDEVLNFGTNSSYACVVGSSKSGGSRGGLLVRSNSGIGVSVSSLTNYGINSSATDFPAVQGSVSGFGSSSIASAIKGVGQAGAGIEGTTTTGVGGKFSGNATRGNLMLPRLTVNPSDVTADQFANINGKLCYSDGTNWRRVSDDVIV